MDGDKARGLFAFCGTLRETFDVKTILTLSAEQASGFICTSGIVAFPTETVYGLGGNVFDEAAVAKIFEAKRRPADNPLIAHIGELDQIRLLSNDVTAFAQKLIDAFFPGPLTVVLEKTVEVPLIATAGLDTIGVRMPRNELARDFLKACGTPVVAPSANLSGRPSPTTWQAVYEDLNGRIDCILRGEATEIGLESTVVDCTGELPHVLRIGAVTLGQLRDVIPETVMSFEGQGDAPKSPGLKHRHYSPLAQVVIVDSDDIFESRSTSAYIGIHDPDLVFGLKQIVCDAEVYAHSLFEFFRECDRKRIERIYCESVPETGLGEALMDRIRRAAQD
jgi:L-threonylcarbamoyladenylate synthase